mgnify:CR=1 FL=1
MKVTVEDICNFPEFTNLKVIAGRGGLINPIERCGILDYEFVEGYFGPDAVLIDSNVATLSTDSAYLQTRSKT